MATKTLKGWVNKEITGDGRESPERWVKRETLTLKQTKTKRKRAKNAEKGLLDLIQNS